MANRRCRSAPEEIHQFDDSGDHEKMEYHHVAGSPGSPSDKEILETLELPATPEIPEMLKATQIQESNAGLMVPASTKKITDFFKPLKDRANVTQPLGTREDATHGSQLTLKLKI
ncbi:hypothetical protein NDU88_004462 [Pleurodeles waltl]|uniref:Uncharacterized protein n=1 Tax=Pleurodeles waltl TaxID=8319 RepID=A0AAV7L1J0_PLEWA|nr:hypothetical protein NDU88_004462 [Pleurodeles waltl]